MFDPTAMLADGRWGYICVNTGIDYKVRIPRRVLWNPLRWEVGLGRGRPCPVRLNRDGRLYLRWANLTWALWRKRQFGRRGLQ